MEKNINYLIDYQCPQCGAPATLKETDRLFQCAFCKVKSYLVAKDYFRYLLPHKAPPDKELLYVPYWRFKGMMFSCLPSGIENRFLDTSKQAVSSELFPPSVGLRSQALKLSFINSDSEGWFIKPDLPFHRAIDTVISQGNTQRSGTILHQSLIGESLSLIYAPFYVTDRIMDAVLNEPVSPVLDDSFEKNRFSGGPASKSIRFISTLCPNCGWDLKGHRDALVLHCTNCKSMWRASKKEMTRINVAHMPIEDNKTTLFLPFWRIRANVTGIHLKTYEDLVGLANLPKAIQPGWDRIPMYFWGPAFKVRPRSFLRLTHHVTLTQPRNRLTPEMPEGEMHPVTLPLSESIQTVKLNIAGIIRPKKRIEECLDTLTVDPKRYLLVFLPFAVRHHDLVQTSFNIAVNRNQLALAGNL